MIHATGVIETHVLTAEFETRGARSAWGQDPSIASRAGAIEDLLLGLAPQRPSWSTNSPVLGRGSTRQLSVSRSRMSDFGLRIRTLESR